MAVATAAMSAVAATTATAAAPSAPLPECATPVSPGGLSPGQPAVGFTVRRGETVERFDVTILGVMEDGLGPGRDMIVIDADADAPVIREGGISAGMSGSPVYTHDGRLVGAVGYAFAVGSSPVGGVTPAPDMLRMLSEPGGTSAAPDASPARIALEGPVRRRARQAGVDPAALDAGLRRLPLPLSISGLRPERAAMLRAAAERRGLPFVVTGGGRPSPLSGVEPSASVAPGDSFAAALSYGDATFSAIGTTTYVCDGSVLAFGHPFLFSGPTLLGASRAWVFGIVDDAFIPFKLASVTAPVGIVDRDRLAALRGQAGQRIPTFPVIQDTVARDTGERRLGSRTAIVRTPGDGRLFLPDIAVAHAFGNIDVTFDQISGGSALVSWTLRGRLARGDRPWTLRRSNRFASSWDISFVSVLELWSDLLSLSAQSMAPVEFDRLRIEVGVEEAVRRFRIARVRWATGGKRFRPASALRVRPGQRIRARVRLRDPQTGASRSARMRFRAPRRPGAGTIRIAGGARQGGDPDLFFDDDELDFFACASGASCADGAPKARSFNRLLARLRSRPRNDELVGQARFRRAGARRTVVRRLGRVVAGRESVRVIVRPRR